VPQSRDLHRASHAQRAAHFINGLQPAFVVDW